MRILCGAFLLPHTFAKLSNIEGASHTFAKLGLRPPRFFVVFTSMMELTAAFGLISGLYPRLGALIAATILVVAAWAIAKLHGPKWRWQHPGDRIHAVLGRGLPVRRVPALSVLRGAR